MNIYSESNVISISYKLLCLCFLLDAFAAYSVFGVPLPWLGMAAVTLLSVHFVKIYKLPTFSWFSVFVYYSILSTLLNVIFADYYVDMPLLSTTPYPVYIGLRIYVMLMALMIAYIFWNLLFKGYYERFIQYFITLGCIISTLAIYIYVAQIFGLPEIPRTRVSTSGTIVDEIRFSYAFHRALGTFREPSHLAEWLILPLFLAFSQGRKKIVSQLLMSLTLLLTGSLMGVLSIGIGFLTSLAVFNPFGKRTLKILLYTVVIISAGYLLASFSISSFARSDTGIIQVVLERLSPILERGIRGSNRAYVYDFIDITSVPLAGYGMGNANLMLTNFLGGRAVSSFLSIYYGTLYSTGYPGVLFLIIFLAVPIITVLKNKSAIKQDLTQFCLFSMYVAYLVTMTVNREELSFTFIAAYVLVLFYYCKPRSAAIV